MKSRLTARPGAGAADLRRRIAVLAAASALTVASAAQAATPPDLTGYWNRKLAAATPAPGLTVWGRGQAAAQRQLRQDNERWCQPLGMPAQMEGPEPIAILQDRTELLLLSERLAKPRNIYTAATSHPDPDTFDFTSTGHALGRWEGDTLVVETIGFTDGLGPAGAPRTDQSRLVERFRLTSPDELIVQSTWTDPKALARPYSWTWTYSRAPGRTTAREYYCDPRDQGRPVDARAR